MDTEQNNFFLAWDAIRDCVPSSRLQAGHGQHAMAGAVYDYTLVAARKGRCGDDARLEACEILARCPDLKAGIAAVEDAIDNLRQVR